MNTYRVALLGCGGRGRQHGRAYRSHPRTELVATCDLDPARLESISLELGVSAQYRDLDMMLDQAQPDIVAIPTATQFHFPLAMRCLEWGCHIDVEKPITEHLGQADILMAKAQELSVEIAVHHQWRTSPAMTAVRKSFANGSIGDLRFLYASGKGYYGGYGLPNIGTHLLNQLFSMAGNVKAVSGHVLTDGRQIAPEDVLTAPQGMGIMAGENVTALLEFENGVCAVLLQHRFERIDLSAHVVEAYGSNGRLLWRPHGAFLLPGPNIPPGPNLTEWAGDNGQWESLPLEMPSGWQEGMDCHVDEFAFVDQYVQALDLGTHHPCDGASGRHVLEVINGIYTSAVEGHKVVIDEMKRGNPLHEFRTAAGLSPEPEPGPEGYDAFVTQEDARLGRVV